jgi:uncharacterized membrane protein
MIDLKLLFIISLIMLIVDGIWLTLMKDFYGATVKSIQNSGISFKMPGAVVAYALIAIGIYYFVLKDEVDKKNNCKTILEKGFMFGLVSYGIFNGTNHAILNNWDCQTSTVDTLWGCTMAPTVSYLSYLVHNKLK